MANEYDKKLKEKLEWAIILGLFTLAGIFYYRDDGLIGIKALFEVLLMFLIAGGVALTLGLLFSRTKPSLKNILLPVLSVLVTGFEYWLVPGNLKFIVSIGSILGFIIFLVGYIDYAFGKK